MKISEQQRQNVLILREWFARNVDPDRCNLRDFFYPCGAPSCLFGYATTVPEFVDKLFTDFFGDTTLNSGEIFGPGSFKLLFASRRDGVYDIEIFAACDDDWCSDYMLAIYRLNRYLQDAEIADLV